MPCAFSNQVEISHSNKKQDQVYSSISRFQNEKKQTSLSTIQFYIDKIAINDDETQQIRNTPQFREAEDSVNLKESFTDTMQFKKSQKILLNQLKDNRIRLNQKIPKQKNPQTIITPNKFEFINIKTSNEYRSFRSGIISNKSQTSTKEEDSRFIDCRKNLRIFIPPINLELLKKCQSRNQGPEFQQSMRNSGQQFTRTLNEQFSNYYEESQAKLFKTLENEKQIKYHNLDSIEAENQSTNFPDIFKSKQKLQASRKFEDFFSTQKKEKIQFQQHVRIRFNSRKVIRKSQIDFGKEVSRKLPDAHSNNKQQKII
ncbi:UNKNOWN [Stylonychia lemnae]|uniref:Uncharacterized protein n=1 Tax=Stylonychia lemnae TaxID=5949 RepID=A0A078AAV8_STYLE|nr:UNKNOWN [Stylonychia lemnae]|eukprot:CDW78986.1 UNKNOWN [Stylonychia lemnae]